jgi:mercuric ion binding protein
MKTLLISLMIFLAASSFGQTVETKTFTVKGNCEECKERIENAADIKGVKLLKWDPATKIASATYDPSKITLLQIEQSIAATGYDAGPVKGDSKAYGKLPKCCKYRDSSCAK